MERLTMMRCTCPTCGRVAYWSATEYRAHLERCATTPAWRRRANDPAATRHPRGWIRGGAL